jgi:hypothetical protein
MTPSERFCYFTLVRVSAAVWFARHRQAKNGGASPLERSHAF